jgi:two-component system NarL family sensor kinase
MKAIAEALNSSASVRDALERTLASIAELLGLETGWVWLIDPETGHFYNAAACNLPPYLQEPVRMTGATCWCIEEFRSGSLTTKNVDVMECSRLRPAVRARKTAETRGLHHHASIPLYFQDKPLGIMNVTGHGFRGATAAQLRILSTIAYQLGVAIERARLAEEMATLARTEERSRIAREIHDTLAQSLTAIALQIESAMEQVEASPAEARLRLERALDTARSSVQDARRSVQNLRASPLSDRPLPQALSALAREFTSDSGILCDVEVSGGGRLPPEIENELYRIAQEALTNVRRHAAARHAFLRLALQPRRVTLEIEDDGRGIARLRPDPTQHGLRGMRERAKILGGSATVRRSPSGGTLVRAVIPTGEQAR